jgi:serine/threonine-protein kinase HipA
MAESLWGKVYFKDIYAGRLEEQPGGRCVFTYDASYLKSKNPAISYTLPLQVEPHICERGLHPFFDNLVAEGWLKNAQAKALGKNPNNRFALLLGFGYDLAGAVSVIDPDPLDHKHLNHLDEATVRAALGRASLSGVQRKLLLVKDGKEFRPVKPKELSTHIAKLPAGDLTGLVELEFLTTLAVKKLLPRDEVVDLEIAEIPLIKETALIVPRFDRKNGKRLHFEEFNSLLNRYSGDDKYEGSYEEMGKFISQNHQCIPAEAERLFKRILACLLVGNTDAHLKNFAMFHVKDGMRLTPSYDLVASAIYPQYSSIALSIAGAKDLNLSALKPKHLLLMGKGFGLSEEVCEMALQELENSLDSALEVVEESSVGAKKIRDQLQKLMEAKWKGSFASTGKLLSKKQSKGAKPKK